jgi:ketosteroid isomerase-like protein
MAMLSEMDSGDIEKSLQYATEDVISMPPDQPPVVGKVALRAWSQKFFGDFSVDMTHQPEETTDFGEIVIHRGNVTGTATPKSGGDPIRLNNKYLWVLRKEPDGTLRVWRSIFNSN